MENTPGGQQRTMGFFPKLERIEFDKKRAFWYNFFSKVYIF